jgi:O-antigen biosynthesis protein
MMQKFVGKLMPWGTKRRHIWQLGLTALQIIRYQGWRVFISKARKETAGIRVLRFTDSYRHWIDKYEPGKTALETQKQTSQTLKYRPKISVILAVRDSDINQLIFMIRSVVQQTYDNWELVVSSFFDGKEIRAQYAQDPRIKITDLSIDTGISETYNQALNLATGEFIVLLGDKDEMAPFALHEIAKTLNEKPDTDFIYSDEDKITGINKRTEPFFKPDWSPDYFLSFMYTGRLGVYRKQALDDLKGFRKDYEDAQEYDLVLRLTEKTSKIHHIPQILYHRRTSNNLKVSNPNVQPYAPAAAKKALTDYMHRNNLAGSVEDGPWPGSFRLHRNIDGNPLVSIILPSKNKPEILKACLKSVFEKTEYTNFEIIIVDNQSSDEKLLEYYMEIRNHPKVTILHYDKTFNYSELNNFAASRAKGEHLLLLNNDTEVITGEWLSAMLEQSQRKEVGLVGAKLLYPDKTIQHCGVIIGLGGSAGHPFSREISHHQQGDRPDLICNYSAVTAACLMIKKALFDEVGGFDTSLAVDYNDIDLCLKIRKKGYSVVYTPYAQLYHYEAMTRGYHDNPAKMRQLQQELGLMLDRWGGVFNQGDPYYNPNLTLERADYSLKL